MSTKENFIIDVGSRFVKCGRFDKKSPDLILDSCVGKLYFNSKNKYQPEYKEIIGEYKNNYLDFYYEPIVKRGFIYDIDNYNKILKKIFKKAEINEP